MSTAKPKNWERCVVLDDKGRKCRRWAVAYEHYHGDDELHSYFDEPRKVWVRIAVCEKHKDKP